MLVIAVFISIATLTKVSKLLLTFITVWSNSAFVGLSDASFGLWCVLISSTSLTSSPSSSSSSLSGVPSESVSLSTVIVIGLVNWALWAYFLI